MKLGSKLTKRIVSGAAAVAMAVTNLMPSTLGTVFAATYGNSYTVENLLTDYNIVSFNDLEMNTHTVGSVLVGDTLTSNGNYGTFGDGARIDSYAKHIGKLGHFNPNGFMRGSALYSVDNSDYKLYYQTYDDSDQTTVGAVSEDTVVHTDEAFFDTDSAKAAVQRWSNAKASDSSAWVISNDDLI